MQHHADDNNATHGCPPWCRRDHRPGLHPDDQHHASASRRVPLVTGNPALDRDDLAVADAVIVRLLRPTHSDVTWLEVVSEEGRSVRLISTVDSARRLLTVLHELVSDASS
jgi:hypothetical protein